MKSLDEIAELLSGQRGKPPIQKWHPELSGDIDIEIRPDGRWFHEGGEIRRHELVKLFASILRREDDGDYYLVTPVEKWRIRVLDQPLLMVDCEAGGDQVLMKTNTDDWVLLNEEHPLTVSADPETGEPYPTVQLANGLQAKVGRAVFYRLVEMGREQSGQLWVESAGQRFLLGSTEQGKK
ncbi:MAG TPA: DUF1285 domain-containing protein [Spongiibacteraceae bacterium]|nr:hypothetical protein [Spongiibacteraceae bacterium]HCS29643.1 DUF1285 domain-containing protein [Spongiibacteraceae bacterium]